MAKPVTREITVTDTTAPELTLLGSNPVTAAMGQTYAPSGATAKDTVDGDLTVISSYAPFPIKDLVSFWRFNEGTGEIVFDHIGNNHLEFAGSAQFSPEGIERGAVSMNNNGSLLVDDNPSLDITDALSISAWFHPTADNANWDKIICKTRADNAPDNIYPYYLGYNDKKRLVFGLTGTSTVSAASDATPPVNNWTHAVGTWDGTDVKLYINGILQQVSAKLAAPLRTHDLELRLGARNSTTNRFRGRIDEVAIWQRGLSDEEAQNLYKGGPSIDTDTAGGHTVHYAVIDRSGNIATGTRTVHRRSGYPARSSCWR